MKAIIISLLCFLALLPLRADDAPRIPNALNSLLPKIRAGMTIHGVEAVLSTAYPKMKIETSESGDDWSDIAFHLDRRFVLSIFFKDRGNGKQVILCGEPFDLRDVTAKHHVVWSLSLNAGERLKYWLTTKDIFDQAKLDGVDYRKLLRAAVAMDAKSLSAIFQYTANGPNLMGAGADDNCDILHQLLIWWGDRKFAHVLSGESLKVRSAVVNAIEYAWGFPGWKPNQFPETYQLGIHYKVPIIPYNAKSHRGP
jgi:hypothetical protein